MPTTSFDWWYNFTNTTFPNTTVVIWVTIMSTLDRTGQSPVETVPACPIQIRAHHHIDVFTDINEDYILICERH